jgi:hypothetical protein
LYVPENRSACLSALTVGDWPLRYSGADHQILCFNARHQNVEVIS